VRAILDTSVLLAGAEARPDLTGIEGRVSSVSYGELNFGVSVAKTAEGGASRLARMQRIIAVYGSGVPFDDLVAASYGYLFGVSLRAGRRSRTRMADLMIAATAHHLGVPLITRNTADFAAVSSHVEIVAR
jgi:predicted nucleic acid-binding protein